MDPALAEVVQLLGRKGRQALLSGLRSRETLEHFVQSEQPHLPELDQLMPLMDALGVKRGKIMSDGLRKMIQYLAGKFAFSAVPLRLYHIAEYLQAKLTSCPLLMQAIYWACALRCYLAFQS